MDEVKARDLETKLRGTTIDGWMIESLAGFGKSAAVFRAVRGAEFAAIKVFDEELIAKYGDNAQHARIERELTLIGANHPNLVRILAGGVHADTASHYVIMEYLDGPNLRDCLANVPPENTASLIAQLASAARFLEEAGYVHRDIKPANVILLHNFNRLVLLDFGVIRPLAGSDLTDADGIQPFIGTLRYSSPEFLLRQEEDSVDGWRAVTFYQIGAVLHDLIMRYPLFEDEAEPYPRLVNAVQHTTPQIQSSGIEFRLVELARLCLMKPWRTRLQLVNWQLFEIPISDGDPRSALKERVTRRGAAAQAASLDPVATNPDEDAQNLRRETLDFLRSSTRAIRAENAALPPVEIHALDNRDGHLVVQFRRSARFGLPRDLTMYFQAEVLDVASRVIQVAACAKVSFDAPAADCDLPCRPVFRGSFDGGSLFVALEGTIYDLIDQAQQVEVGATGDGAWLMCGEH